MYIYIYVYTYPRIEISRIEVARTDRTPGLHSKIPA